MWCLRCGVRDPGASEKCANCGNSLGPVDNRVGYFNQMMVLTGELLTNKLSLQDYEKSIQWATEAVDDMGKNLEPIEKQVESFNFDELALSLMKRPLSSFREGIETFHEGLEKLRFYVYEQNQGHLHQGLTLLEKANNLFNYTADTANYMIGDLRKNLNEEQIAMVEKEVQANVN
jgi:cob(I)alamin adenosyltransferase